MISDVSSPEDHSIPNLIKIIKQLQGIPSLSFLVIIVDPSVDLLIVNLLVAIYGKEFLSNILFYIHSGDSSNVMSSKQGQ
jgi:hypothetical protein